MFLKSLELTGFKSFAKRTRLTFEPGITAIVGPNGSGKSNIADAIRWVLGAQSKKAVRGKVSTDVIFSGTDQKPAMSLAEVSMTFDNSGKQLPYDFEEVVVTRRLYRSGDSEYLINGSRVRLLDLQHAFAVAGIGAENYTVISQGLVDKVLTQTPRERRGLFEEAAGVRQFFLKRDEARRKLSETATNLGRVGDVLRELSPRLKSLRRQAEALAKREEVEAKLAEVRTAYYGHRYRELVKTRRATKAKQDEVGGEFTKLGEELTALTAEVDALRKSQQGLTLNRLLADRNGLRDRREGLQERLNKASTAKEVARTTLERAEAQRLQAADRLETLGPAASLGATPTRELDEQIAELEWNLADLPDTPEQLADQPGRLQASAAKLTEAIAALEAAIDAGRTAELKELVANARRATDEITAAASGGGDFAATLERRSTLQTRLAELKGKRASVIEAARLRKEQHDRQEKERTALADQVAELDRELAAARDTIGSSETEIAAVSGELKEVNGTLESLESKIAEEQQKSFGETDELTKREESLRTKQRTHDAYRTELSDLNLELAKVETRLDDLVREAKAKLGDAFPPAGDADLPPAEQGTEEAIAKLEQRLLEMGGIDPEVTAEHKEVEERHAFLTAQSEDLTKAKQDLEKVIRELEAKSRTLFTEAFEKINAEFGTYFQKLFGGGRAELKLVRLHELEEGEEPRETGTAEYGIEIRAVPPGKRLKSLAQLSGGERTLTSNALLFAILSVNPSPFVMLDEVDAALDEANTGRFASTLGELGERTQFLVVTHNRDTMRAAAMLYGVSMDSTGVSTMLSLKLPEAEKVAQAA